MSTGLNSEIIKNELVVKEKVFLTPHYIRIILNGDALEQYRNLKPGANNKILVPIADGSLVRRTYTCRALDFEKMEMHIDFVAHGETGPASKWALHAEPGQKLTVMMRQKTKDLIRKAEWYLLAGDHSALPVIAAHLEVMGPEAEGVVFIEVYDEEDILELKKPEGIEVNWIFNAKPGESEKLTELVKGIKIPGSKDIFVFAAAENKVFAGINSYLKHELNLEKDHYNTFSYWKLGEAEE